MNLVEGVTKVLISNDINEKNDLLQKNYEIFIRLNQLYII
jgi:hypothetical protein